MIFGRTSRTFPYPFATAKPSTSAFPSASDIPDPLACAVLWGKYRRSKKARLSLKRYHLMCRRRGLADADSPLSISELQRRLMHLKLARLRRLDKKLTTKNHEGYSISSIYGSRS